jgi:gluconolactonase
MNATKSLLPELLESDHAERIGTGFTFTEGPLWDPRGHFIFADVRDNKLYRVVPGSPPQLLRQTSNGNGTTFDLQGRVVQCEGLGRRLTRWDPASGQAEVLVERFGEKRFNRPNDVICDSRGALYFSDPAFRVPVAERELDAAIWRVSPQNEVTLLAHFEYPNGLCLSPDERTMYVANTRWNKYIHEVVLDEAGNVQRRRIFADMTADPAQGSPDGIKCDSRGRVFCTGPGGIWVFTPEGAHIGTIRCPQPAVNFCFGGRDLKTLFVCAHDSIYTLRVKVAGHPHPWNTTASA